MRVKSVCIWVRWESRRESWGCKRVSWACRWGIVVYNADWRESRMETLGSKTGRSENSWGWLGCSWVR